MDKSKIVKNSAVTAITPMVVKNATTVHIMKETNSFIPLGDLMKIIPINKKIPEKTKKDFYCEWIGYTRCQYCDFCGLKYCKEKKTKYCLICQYYPDKCDMHLS